MKIRNLIMSLLAVAALTATGCREEEQDLGLPEVKVGTTQLSFDAGIGTNTVTVNTTRDWKAVATVDWIDVSPKSGVGYENAVLTISVLENEGYNRTGSVRVDIGYDYKTILVHQEGPLGEKTEGTGALEDPFTPAGAAAAASALAADEEAGPYYIKGIITTISTTFEASGTYGNASFFISEDGTENTKSFQVYQTYYLGNKKWTSSLGPDVKVGDEVIIYGKITNFKGNTPETVGKGGSYIYSLNGETGGVTPGEGDEPKGTGTLEDPYNPAGAADAVKDLTWTDKDNYDKIGPVYVKIADNGTYTQSGTFGNATFYMTEDGESGTEFYAYRILYLGNKKYTSGDDIKVGDEVIVYGEIMNYRGNTPETVQGTAYLYSLNGKTGGDDPAPQPGDYKSVTVAEFLAAAESQSQVYELVGTIGGSINTTYGNFDLTDATGTVYVYGMTATNLGYGAKNDQSYASLGLKEGDKIRVRGYRGSYTNPNSGEKKDELVYSWFIEKVDGDDPTPQPGDGIKFVKTNTVVSGQSYLIVANGKMAKPVAEGKNYGYLNVEDATIEGDVITVSDETNAFVFEGGQNGFTIKQSDGRYLYMDSSHTSFNVSATPTEGQNWFVSFNNDGSALIRNQNQKFVQFSSNYNSYGCYIDNQDGGVVPTLYVKQDGDTPTPQPGGDVKAVTIAQFQAEPESQTQVYELVGVIGGNVNTTYGNFDLADETGTVYVYGLTATNLGYGAKNDKSYASLGLQVGDKIRVRGYRGSYTNPNSGEKKDELVYSWFIEKVDGGDPNPQPGGEVKAVTIAEFNAASESNSQVYELVGTMSNITNTTYGNFDLADETGTVYVYGLTATELGYGTANDKSYASLGLQDGDKIKIRGYRGSYGDKIEVVSAWFIEKVGGDDPAPQPGGTVSFDTNASAQTWSEETDGTYGAGFSSTTQGIKIGYYKHTGNTDAVAPKDDHVRYYKNCAIVVTAPQGKKFKSIKFIAPTANNCVGMNILEGGGTCNADTATLTMSWTGSASKVVFHAVNGQVRSKSITVEFE